MQERKSSFQGLIQGMNIFTRIKYQTEDIRRRSTRRPLSVVGGRAVQF